MIDTRPSPHASLDITNRDSSHVAVPTTAATAMTTTTHTSAVTTAPAAAAVVRHRVEQFFVHPQHYILARQRHNSSSSSSGHRRHDDDGGGGGGGAAETTIAYDLLASPSLTAATPDERDGHATAAVASSSSLSSLSQGMSAAATKRTNGGAGAATTTATVTAHAVPTTAMGHRRASLTEPYASDDAVDGDTDSCHRRHHDASAHALRPHDGSRRGVAAAAAAVVDDNDDDVAATARASHARGDNNSNSHNNSHNSSGSSDGGSSGGGGGERRKALSTLLLTGLMYSLTTGGAYGIEESVLGGGALLTIIFLLVIPLLMGLPMALVVAELTCAVPSDAGFLMWLHLAFHRSVYLTMTVLTVFYTVVDNALYPVMFSDYCCTVLTCSRAQTAALRVGMVVVVYALNLVGVGVVGVASVVLTLLTVLPFVLLLATQQATMRGYVNWPALAFVPAVVDWTTFVTTASWNLSGLEQAAAVVEEVPQPQRTLMRAFGPLLVLVLLTYIPAIVAGASVTPGPLQRDEWQTGFWAIAALRVGGRVLQAVMVLGSILSAFGMTLSTLCTTTRLLAGVATTGVFPGALGRALSARNARFDTHHVTLTINAAVTALVSVALEFDALVQVDQCLYGIRVVLILVAFVVLRRRYPHLRRPFRVPLQGVWLYVAFALPFASFCALTVIALVNNTTVVALCAGIVGGTSLVCGLLCVFVRKADYLGQIVTVMYEHSE